MPTTLLSACELLETCHFGCVKKDYGDKGSLFKENSFCLTCCCLLILNYTE